MVRELIEGITRRRAHGAPPSVGYVPPNADIPMQFSPNRAYEPSCVTQNPRYVPALGLATLTGFYDTVPALTMRERRWRRPLLRDRIAAHVGSGGRVVDVGADAGTLAIALAARGWRRGLAGALDLKDGSAEAVVMSLLLTIS